LPAIRRLCRVFSKSIRWHEQVCGVKRSI
jgi:hypothetical protein